MSKIEQRFSIEGASFYIDQINQHLDQLTRLGISQPPVILSGSAVFLYETALKGQGERMPTDLDLVLQFEDFLEVIRNSSSFGLDLQDQPRATKWGM